jgi:hypothetical protein
MKSLEQKRADRDCSQAIEPWMDPDEERKAIAECQSIETYLTYGQDEYVK